MDSTTTLIRAVSGVVFLGFFAAFVIVAIFYILTLSGVLKKCAPSSRTMEPAMLWLLLVPILNIIWSFFVVLAMAKSLANEFRLRNIPSSEPEPGKTIGLAMCICACCAIIPILGFLAAPIQLVLWIMYWVKMAGYSKVLDRVPAANLASESVQSY